MVLKYFYIYPPFHTLLCAASDTLILSQGLGFSQFYDDLDSIEDSLLGCDNTSAIKLSTTETNAMGKPSSRHLALRFCRVREAAKRLFFVPTKEQRADPLTKALMSPRQRQLCFVFKCLDPIYSNRG